MISIERVNEAVPDTVGLETLVVADMVARAIAFIEEQTGQRYFREVEEFSEYICGSGTRNLQLRHIPVALPDSDAGTDYVFTLEARAFPGSTATTLTDYDVRVGGREAWLTRLLGSVWTASYEYRATYLRGYEVDGLPSDIEGLILDLVSNKLAVRGSEGMRSETIGGYSYTRFGAGDLEGIEGAMDTINAWRRLVTA